MPVIDGEKWACASCIKGHRVSGCTHTDRELHHINPKGRPVKQCEHCRGARKSKSHHAKCECGDKKDKDKSKDNGDAKGEKLADVSVEEVSNHAVVDGNNCRCHTGAKCICGKKDTHSLKVDTGKHTLHGARAKPKLSTTHSESTLTVFANGHHKPCHRNNNSAHVSGVPYKIPRPHTLHGHSAFAGYSPDCLQLLQELPETQTQPQRSMDTWSLSNNDFYAMFGPAQRSVDSLPLTPLTGALDSTTLQDTLFSAPGSAMFAQESNSPSESHLSESISGQKWWGPPISDVFGMGSLSTSPSQDCLTNLDNDWAIPSAGLNDPSWSAGDLPLDPNKLNDPLTQPISQSGESSQQSAPGLTTASSTHSDVGDSALFGDLEFRNPPSGVGEPLSWEENYRLPTSGTDVRPAPTLDRPPLELDFYDRMNKAPLVSSEEISFVSNLGFPNASPDVAQVSKEVNSATTNTALPSTNPNDGSAAYSSADYSEPRAVTIPNNMDDVVSNSAWLALDNSAFGPSSLDVTLDGYDMVGFPNWI